MHSDLPSPLLVWRGEGEEKSGWVLLRSFLEAAQPPVNFTFLRSRFRRGGGRGRRG
jgi:hypothetical protein